MDARHGSGRHSHFVRAPQSLVAGLALVGLGAFAVWAGSDLTQGTLGAIGPGFMPRWLAYGVMACGFALAAVGILRNGADVPRFALRGPLLVMLALLSFAATIRPSTIGPIATPGLGLIVAGPLAVLIGGYATAEARLGDLIILALILTAGCMVLFGDLLNLPIPIFPTAIVKATTGLVSSKAMLRGAAAAFALGGLGLLVMRRGRHGPRSAAPPAAGG